MQLLKYLFLLCLLALGCRPATSALAAAPGWIGGGGLLRKDSGNPWWVKNTKEVSVCVEVDEANFGISQERAEEIARSALAWWKDALKEDADSPIGNDLGVGRQNFSLSSHCTPTTDLRIQFGVLSTLQRLVWKVYVGEAPQEYAGIAIRTDYDPVNLKGRGFIYFSPQAGPLKLRTVSGQLEKPWSVANGRIAAMFLVHELGHVFGFDHGTIGLMSPGWMEWALSDWFEPFVTGWPKDIIFPNPFRFERGSDIECYKAGEYSRNREFFGLGAGDTCLSFETNATKLAIYEGPSEAGPWTLLSSGEILSRTELDILSGGTLYLTPEQRVFERTPGDSARNGPYLGFGLAATQSSHVELKSLDGRRLRHLVFRAGPPRFDGLLPNFDLTAIVDGKPVFDIIRDNTEAAAVSFSETAPRPAPNPIPKNAREFARRLKFFRPR